MLLLLCGTGCHNTNFDPGFQGCQFGFFLNLENLKDVSKCLSSKRIKTLKKPEIGPFVFFLTLSYLLSAVLESLSGPFLLCRPGNPACLFQCVRKLHMYLWVFWYWALIYLFLVHWQWRVPTVSLIRIKHVTRKTKLQRKKNLNDVLGGCRGGIKIQALKKLRTISCKENNHDHHIVISFFNTHSGELYGEGGMIVGSTSSM